ncbi:MAG: N-acetyltransferase family protein [Ferruginibacter sp.]|nr:N-acetyltransferase family protein [Ferruginibacter sp.]
MIFRDATIDDLPFIVDIYNSTIPGRMVTADIDPVNIEDKIEWFKNHNPSTRPIWIVTNDQHESLGWVSFQDFYGRPAYKGTAEISIYLSDKFRGRGFGKKILSYAFSKCNVLGIHTLLGFIFKHNEVSINLFAEMGFEEWADLKEIAAIDNQRYSLVIMGRRINS